MNRAFLIKGVELAETITEITDDIEVSPVKWVELNEISESPLENSKMLCKQCYSEASQIKNIVDEIKDIQYMLDNNDETIKGDRRGWKVNMKVLKNQLLQQGYDFDNF